VATFKAFGKFRTTDDMERGRAVYQDLTRSSLRGRGYEGPLVAPRESAQHLVELAADHEFTLFEYFQTDIAAHRNDAENTRHILGLFDEFLSVVLAHAETDGHLLLLTSDHGNIEDNRTHLHTDNPVPFVAVGSGADRMKEAVNSLADVVPALLDLYPGSR
jgi:bisphosphoglycerate-independent phosphoglycerate mutase (AlkP superfamily)